MTDILGKAEIESVLNKLSEKIASSKGVEICMRQGSRNFENWVQVELSSILSEVLGCSIDRIRVEKELSKANSVDIAICDDVEGMHIQAGIAIKVIAMGGKGGSYKTEISKDEHALSINLPDRQKILLWVVYHKKGYNVEKQWSAYKPQNGRGVGPIPVMTKDADQYKMVIYAHLL